MDIKSILFVVFISTALFGCASAPLAPYQPSIQNLELLKKPDIPPLKVGEFTLAPGKDPSIDKSLGIRGHTLTSPNENSFARYLKEGLITDLRTAGKYDQNVSTIIHGWLIHNQLDAAGVSVNSASLGAKFSVNRGEQTLFEKQFYEKSQWESSFMGGIAIPRAINEYTALYQRLLKQLYGDNDFRNAIRRGE